MFAENASMSPSNRERICITGTDCGFASSSSALLAGPGNVSSSMGVMGVTSQFPTFVETALLKPTLASLMNSYPVVKPMPYRRRLRLSSMDPGSAIHIP